MAVDEEGEVELLIQLAATNDQIRWNVDLIPIDNWGFDDSTRERLRQTKHSIVKGRLSEGDRKRLSKAAKHRLAKGVGGACRTVSDVVDWMAHCGFRTKPNEENTNVEEAGSYSRPCLSPIKAQTKLKSPISTGRKASMEVEKGQRLITGTDLEESGSVGEEHASGNKETLSNTSLSKSKIDEKRTLAVNKKTTFEESASTKDDINGGVARVTARVPASDPLQTRKLAMKKLQAKLEQLRALRRGKKTAQQCEEQRKLRRRMSKMKLKDRRQLAKRQRTDVEGPPAKKSKSEDAASTPLNDDGELVFSKFDFIVKDDKQKMSKKEKGDTFTGRDYKRLLDKAGARMKKIDAIRMKNPEKAQHIESDIRWRNAMHRTEGHKIKDNPELLRKALKRKMQMRERRKKVWEKREDFVREKQAKQQENRNANIQARKNMIRKNKMDKLKRKGRIL